jgi:hypothetical protein
MSAGRAKTLECSCKSEAENLRGWPNCIDNTPLLLQVQPAYSTTTSRKLRRSDYDNIICRVLHALLDFQVPTKSKLNAAQNKHWTLQ